jgi:hypothetical protein
VYDYGLPQGARQGNPKIPKEQMGRVANTVQLHSEFVVVVDKPV